MKNTNRALLSSVVALVLCCSMLIGSTFAWFTDEVTAGVNTIQAGNLDVVLSNDDGEIDENTVLFALPQAGQGWEPGVVVYENLTVANNGTLALKYDLSINFDIENATKTPEGKTLADVLKVGVVPGGVSGDRDEVLASVQTWESLKSFVKKGTLKANGDNDVYGVVIYWQPTANDNDFNMNNGQTTVLSIDLGVNLFATQAAVEEDSFGPDYDVLAPLPVASVTYAPQYVNTDLTWGSYGQWSPTAGLESTLKTAYTFSCTETLAEVQAGDYADWHCDFYVKLDRDLGTNQLFLGGNYGTYGWIGFHNGDVTPSANEEIALLGSVTSNPWTYEDVVQNVGTFICGVGDVNNALNGATFTVMLRLTNPDDASEFYNIATINYTFTEEVSNATELADALANGTSVSLTDDITVTSTLVLPKDAKAVIDLNGHDLSYAVSNSGASAIINNKGDLTIVGNGTISFVAENPDLNAIPSYATNTITNTGTLTIGEGVTVTNGSDGGASYAVDNHGTFILNGGTLIGDRCALRIAKFNQDNVKFVMNSGLVQAKTPAWIQLPGSDSSVAPTITVEINGGTMQSTKTTSSDNDVLYTYSFGNSHANTRITINGGEFLGGTVSIGSGYKGDAPALTIAGGTFEYDVLQWLAGDTSSILYAANK